jgi:hypothetical protein
MNHNGKWNERQWQRIEEEYQEPARDVIRVWHHEMRVPLCQIAELIYISETTLRGWCKIWGIETRRQGYIKKETPGKVQLRARLMGYDDVSQAIAAMRADGLRWDDICLKLKCAESTIARYMPDAAKGRYNLSEGGLETKRAVARRLNEQMERGEIERGGFAKVPLEMVTPLR